MAFLGLLSTAILQTIKLERAESGKALTSDTIRLAWWALPVAGVAVGTYIICRGLRQPPACLGAMVGCLVGAFVPVPKDYAHYRDVEAAYMGVLYKTLYHTLCYSSWGAVAGGVIAAIAWTQWVHHDRRTKEKRQALRCAGDLLQPAPAINRSLRCRRNGLCRGGFYDACPSLFPDCLLIDVPHIFCVCR
jgi:hypothetical protein